MNFSINTIKQMLDIVGDIDLTPVEMVSKLKVTFLYSKYPLESQLSEFAKKLEMSFIDLGVSVIPYDSATISLTLEKKVRICFLNLKNNLSTIFKGQFSFFFINLKPKIKSGIATIAIGHFDNRNLPIDYTLSLRHNPIIAVIAKSKEMEEITEFEDHLETSLQLFAWTMSNLIISVGHKNWTLYSYNASHPTFETSILFKDQILNTLIPKIYAPVQPPKLTDFNILDNTFDPTDHTHVRFVDDLIRASKGFSSENLFPAHRKVTDLKFRSPMYRWLGKLILDQRTGMSYGFLARQLPSALSEIKKNNSERMQSFFRKEGENYVSFDYKGSQYYMRVPDVWVLTSRSGSDKNNLNPKSDIVKMGLVKGKMQLMLPIGASLSKDFRPSFDTRVILSHCMSNAIFSSIVHHFNQKLDFAARFENNGMSLSHWHGYIKPNEIPNGIYYYGQKNPPVSCSAPQSAIYAFLGKQKIMNDILENSLAYVGDIHIEPQHGINFSFPSLMELVSYLKNRRLITKLGNFYFDFYE